MTPSYTTVRQIARHRVKCRFCGKSVVRTKTFMETTPVADAGVAYVRLDQMAKAWRPQDDRSDQCMSGACWEINGGAW